MHKHLSILFINNDSASRSLLADILIDCRRPIEVSVRAVLLDEALMLLKSASPPQVVVLEVRSIAQGVRDIFAIHSINSLTIIITTSVTKSAEWVFTLIRAGATEYLTPATNTTELEDLLERAIRLFEQNHGAAKGKVITVYNPSGGMGATTVAVNLAAAMTAKGEMTALVDLNPFSSDVSTFLDLAPAHTLGTLQMGGRPMSSAHLMDNIIQHTSGVRVLCGPEEIGMILKTTPEQILRLITLMRDRFSVTIIDAGGSLSMSNMELFNGSDVILYPLILTPPAIHNAGRYLKFLKRRGFGPDRVKVVVNRYLSTDDITISEAEDFLDAKVFHTIPNSYLEIKKSIYKGTPLVTGYPHTPITKALSELAGRLTIALSDRSH